MTRKVKTIDLVYIAIFVVLITICSWISIPIIIPITLQTFAIYLAVALLGWKKGTATIIIYVLLGMVGVPVYSGFKAGVGVLLGPTGGYIIGFIFLALVMGLIVRYWGDSSVRIFVAMLIATLICYLWGTVWYITVYAPHSGAVGFIAALTTCVLPYIIPDILKMLLAIFLYRRLKPYMKI